ncbi:MAG: 5-formyltetrahydrofolate cyclo-ligase, partial [Jatrophihabitantaceae bacterium]
MHREEKARLRRELSAARAARCGADVELARSAVRDAVLARSVALGWRCVAGYVPLRTEPGSVELLDALTERGVRVLVPVLLADRDLDWAPWPTFAAAPPARG